MVLYFSKVRFLKNLFTKIFQANKSRMQVLLISFTEYLTTELLRNTVDNFVEDLWKEITVVSRMNSMDKDNLVLTNKGE